MTKIEKIETKYEKGEPKCPECGRKDLEFLRINKNKLLISNCIWCNSTNKLYYSYLDKCSERVFNRIIPKIEKKAMDNENKELYKTLESIKKERII